MSLSPTDSPKVAARTPVDTAAKADKAADLKQATETPETAATATANPAGQGVVDAARQAAKAAGDKIGNEINKTLDGGWLEARGRPRGSNGKRTAQLTPTRGLGGGETELA